MGWGDGIDNVPTTCIHSEGFEDPGPTELPIDWTDAEGSADEFFPPYWETHPDEFHTGATSAWIDGTWIIGICDRCLMGPPIYLPAE